MRRCSSPFPRPAASFPLLGSMLAITAALLATAPAAAEALSAEERSPRRYRLAVFPYLTPLRLEPIYAPIAQALAHTLDAGVRLVTRPTFRAFRRALAAERFEIVFLQPFDYVERAAALGYVPLARTAVDLAALIVAPADGRVRTESDLTGATLAFPPRAAAVSRLALAALRAGGRVPGRDFQVRFEPTHFACLNRVLSGGAHACVTAAGPLALFAARRAGPFRVILRSRAVPGPLFAAHRSLPAAVRARLRAAIVGWQRTAAGRALLERGRLPAFVPARDADYEPVRRLIRAGRGGG